MDIYQSWAVLPCFVLLLLFSALPPFHLADAPPGGRSSRVASLDGLRGFLALSVYFHHSAIYYRYLTAGEWTMPPSGILTMLGQGGVSMFFMITGFLFWGRLMDTNARPGWLRLYIGRVFRIGPLYLAAIAVMMVIVLARTSFILQQPLPDFGKDVGRWLMLGYYSPSFNGDGRAKLVLAGVTWSLHYEWLFYASLPFSALFARMASLRVPYAVGGWVASLLLLHFGRNEEAAFAALFFSGMLSATIIRIKMIPRLPDTAASVLVVCLLTLGFTQFGTAFAALPILLLAAGFHLIAAGASVFGLLVSRPAKRLGDISYGIYLLQGLVLALVFAPWAGRDFALTSPLHYWMVVYAGSLVLVLVALCGFVMIEQPGIALGRRAAGLAAGLTSRAVGRFARS
jgi:peptidoglycan/LPS O-acetylase OafA/YrhL